MGSKRSNWYMIIILVTFSLYLLSSSSVQCNNNNSNSFNRNSLDALVHDYASQALMNRRTGSLYSVSLPANFSAMEVSVVRLRSGSFWTRGVNYTSFSIPPRILTAPFGKRLAIVYQDLGNLSSYYYDVPGYRLVSPVLGFFAYDASNLSAIGNTKLNLSILGDAISVRFPHVSEAEKGNATLECVKFGVGGLTEMTKMSVPNVCFAQDQGHFSVVVRHPPRQPEKKKEKKEKNERFWQWWVVGFGGGFVGLVLVGLVGILVFKFVRRKKIEEMERESERSVALGTIWVGRSKLPSASMIRTQPTLENE